MYYWLRLSRGQGDEDSWGWGQGEKDSRGEGRKMKILWWWWGNDDEDSWGVTGRMIKIHGVRGGRWRFMEVGVEWWRFVGVKGGWSRFMGSRGGWSLHGDINQGRMEARRMEAEIVLHDRIRNHGSDKLCIIPVVMRCVASGYTSHDTDINSDLELAVACRIFIARLISLKM